MESLHNTRPFALVNVVSALESNTSIICAILAYAPNVFDFERFERETEGYICSYTNFLNIVASRMRNVNLAAPK